MKIFISMSEEKEPTAEDAVEFASKFLGAWYKKEYPKLTSVVSLAISDGGGKFRRISREEHVDGKLLTRSAYGFVDQQGNLWKSAGWAGPAKNKPRGTLKDLMNEENLKGRWMYSIS